MTTINELEAQVQQLKEEIDRLHYNARAALEEVRDEEASTCADPVFAVCSLLTDLWRENYRLKMLTKNKLLVDE